MLAQKLHERYNLESLLMRLLSHWPQNRWQSHWVFGPGRAGAEEACTDLSRAHSPAPRTQLLSALAPVSFRHDSRAPIHPCSGQPPTSAGAGALLCSARDECRGTLKSGIIRYGPLVLSNTRTHRHAAAAVTRSPGEDGRDAHGALGQGVGHLQTAHWPDNAGASENSQLRAARHEDGAEGPGPPSVPHVVGGVRLRLPCHVVHAVSCRC